MRSQWLGRLILTFVRQNSHLWWVLSNFHEFHHFQSLLFFTKSPCLVVSHPQNLWLDSALRSSRRRGHLPPRPRCRRRDREMRPSISCHGETMAYHGRYHGNISWEMYFPLIFRFYFMAYHGISHIIFKDHESWHIMGAGRSWSSQVIPGDLKRWDDHSFW